MKLIRYILFPIVPFYYAITWLRNRFFDSGILSSKIYSLPIICVGNLSVGGTGKSPMIEYLVRLLKNEFKVATLSRGYGRSTKGFILANENATANTIGDEPFQFYSKFKNDISVAVDANRQNGIEHLMQLEPKPDVLLLDDAFQHRKVKAGLNILLTTFTNLYASDIVLPTGNLREPRSGANRAQLIVVTKCPENLDEDAKNKIIEKLSPKAHQHVFFSTIKYSEVIFSSNGTGSLGELKSKPFTLVTGIANPKPLIDYLTSEGLKFEHLSFSDHHRFTKNEIDLLKEKEMVLTTEKDFMRLNGQLDDNKLWYLPIETTISNNPQFNHLITRYISN